MTRLAAVIAELLLMGHRDQESHNIIIMFSHILSNYDNKQMQFINSYNFIQVVRVRHGLLKSR